MSMKLWGYSLEALDAMRRSGPAFTADLGFAKGQQVARTAIDSSRTRTER